MTTTATQTEIAAKVYEQAGMALVAARAACRDDLGPVWAAEDRKMAAWQTYAALKGLRSLGGPRYIEITQGAA